MTRAYAVKYKSKSKMLTTKEAVDAVEKEIMADELVKSVKVTEQGQVVSIEVEQEEDFSPVMDKVINVFRKIDDKSEVSFKFALNRDNF